MKIKELIERLQALDPEMQVIMQGDAEGNSYSPLEGVDENCVYIADTTWSGIVYNTTWTPDDADMSQEEWAETLAKPKCLVLYPVN